MHRLHAHYREEAYRCKMFDKTFSGNNKLNIVIFASAHKKLSMYSHYSYVKFFEPAKYERSSYHPYGIQTI